MALPVILHRAVRGEGKWEHTGRTYRSVFRYFQVLDPILTGWLADGVESLREITREDVKKAIATRKGTPARSIHIVLRNVFRALRQERVIFRDPTRGLVFAGINKNPPSVPSDRLAGVALAGKLVRPGHAACSYAWRIPPRRSRRRMSRRVICSGSVIGPGKGCSGRVFAMP